MTFSGRCWRAWLLLAWFVIALGPAAHAAPVTIDLLYVDPRHSSYSVAANKFKKVVEARSHGALKVRVFAGGRWQGHRLDELAIARAVLEGRPQMAIVTASPLAGYNSDLQVLDAPFLFRDYRQVDRVLDGPVGERLLRGLESHGLHGLAFLDCGFRVIASTRPVRSLADFRRLRVRVMQSRTYVNLVRALQGVAVASAVDKIHAMAQKGYIDAADRSYPTYWEFKLYDVFKYITETNHAYAAKVVLANQKFYRGLAPKYQIILRQAAMAARIPQRQAFRAEIRQVKQALAARGVRIITLTPAQREQFVRASQPVVQQVKRMVGAALLRQVESTK